MAPDAAALVAAAVRAACMAKAHRRTVAAVAAAVTASCLQHAKAADNVPGRPPCIERKWIPSEKLPQDEAEVIDARRAARRRQRQRKRARAAELKNTARRDDDSTAKDSPESSSNVAENSPGADVMSVEDSADDDDQIERSLEAAWQKFPDLDIEAIREVVVEWPAGDTDKFRICLPSPERDTELLLSLLPALRRYPHYDADK